MCQTVWIHIRTDDLLLLIWVQTVCKGYQQTTKVAANKERVKVPSSQSVLKKKYRQMNLIIG